MLRWAFLCVLVAGVARAHDVSLDVGGTFTQRSGNNPRVGALSLGLGGAYDFNDAWTVTGLAVVTRDLATRTAESSSPGSTVALLSLGALWLPTDSLMTALAVTGSPPTEQRNATAFTGPAGRTTDVTILSRTWSVGAQWNGVWTTGGFSKWEHTVDLGAGFNRFDVFQRAEVPDTVTGALLLRLCETGQGEGCSLVRGASTPLWQGRFTAGYTATLWQDTDVGVEGSYYVYDTPPSSVGYFSLVSLGRELGNGVPVLPLRLSVRPSLAHRFGPVRVKLSYQFGLYTEGGGALHVLTARASWKVSTHWRITLSLTAQRDVAGAAVSNPGGQGLLGVTYAW